MRNSLLLQLAKPLTYFAINEKFKQKLLFGENQRPNSSLCPVFRMEKAYEPGHLKD
jgi:hypothetical protein